MTQGLSAAQKLVLLAFVAFWLIIYISAAVIIAKAIVRRARRQPPRPASRPDRWLKRGVIAFAVLGLACAAYAYFIEPNWLEVRYVSVHSPKLAAESKPIRIVHVSDLHCEESPRLEPRAAAEIAALKPDLIVYTGDSLNTIAGLKTCRTFLRQISSIAPTYAVQGNWDHYYEIDPLADAGLIELDGLTTATFVRRTQLTFTGWSCGTRNLTVAPPADPDAINIMLYHRPDYAPAAASGGYDLYLAGHTHGGQIALPFYGALVTLAKDGKRFEGGSYQLGRTFINVNRGLGLEGHTAPRIRFLARPEITVIDICP